MKSRQFDLVKLEIETLKTMSTLRKINAIFLLNIKINRPKLAIINVWMGFYTSYK